MDIEKILKSNDIALKKGLFQFGEGDDVERILLKFKLWSMYFFPQYFDSEDAEFHDEMSRYNISAYLGEIDYFVDSAFRGAGKDVKTKLFISFFILNDTLSRKKYVKILSEDITNAVQSTTDIYNSLVNPEIVKMYPDTFEKTAYKREERMDVFTTAKGVKVIADTVGVKQRGALQEATRPDFIWMNDFESRNTLRSAVKTRTIRDNMEEARTGLQKGGCCVYTCNYISEMGNVHSIITEKLSPRKKVLVIPIIKNIEYAIDVNDGKKHIVGGDILWDRYTIKEIDEMYQTDDDFEGERLCKPNASKDIYFDREKLEDMPDRKPIREVAGFKIFREYNPSHRYAGGHDVAGGVGLDSSTSVFIDFDTIPAQVVGTYHSNTIQPESFGDEMYNEANRFGGCLIAPENNRYDQAVLKAKLLGANIYKTGGREIKVGHKPPTIYGWNTNSLTKSTMMSSLKLAVEDGLLELNDPDLKAEAKLYTRNDLIDRPEDIRLTTRHFDLLTACAIAWQMKDHAVAKRRENNRFINTWKKKETKNPAL